MDTVVSYCAKHHRQYYLEKGITKTHRCFQFRDPIHFDSRVERVSTRRLQDRACKFPWLFVEVDIFKFIFGIGRFAAGSIQVELIIIFPYLEAVILELRECRKPPSIRLQVRREITRFCRFTWTIVRSFYQPHLRLGRQAYQRRQKGVAYILRPLGCDQDYFRPGVSEASQRSWI